MELVKSRRTVRHYSKSLKLKIVSEIESGIHNATQAGRYYGIARQTIDEWVSKYGNIGHEIVEVVMKDQKDKIKELESALSDAHIKLKVYEAMLEHAGKDYGFDVKKNTSTGELELVKQDALQALAKAAKSSK